MAATIAEFEPEQSQPLSSYGTPIARTYAALIGVGVIQ
jgi:hypothetical protein